MIKKGEFMQKKIGSLILVISTILSTTSLISFHVNASDNSGWWIKAGPGYIQFEENITIKAMDQIIQGANGEMENNKAVIGEIGFDVTPRVSLAMTIGIPPSTRLVGTGTASSLGKLGEAKYGPAGLSVLYNFPLSSNFKSYLGAGVSYLKIFSTKDGTIQNLKVEDTVGPYIQIGSEYSLNKSLGLFIDVKKLYLKTDATGNLGSIPIDAEVRLDPLVFQTGIVIKF